MMKYLVVLGCLLQATLFCSANRPSFVSDTMINVASSVVNVCRARTGVDVADIEAVRMGEWPETESLKCYMYCLWKQFGMVDNKKELDLKGMLTFFQRIPAYREEVRRAVSHCKVIARTSVSGDNCQYAYTFNRCYANLSPNTYYLF